MILKLKAGNVTVVATAWSAGADDRDLDRVNILAHGGTIGLKISMREFCEDLVNAEAEGRTAIDFTAMCETQQETGARLAALAAAG